MWWRKNHKSGERGNILGLLFHTELELEWAANIGAERRNLRIGQKNTAGEPLALLEIINPALERARYLP